MITSLFRKTIKVSTNKFKIPKDINRILINWKRAKILLLHKSLFINQLEILPDIVVKQEVEALHMSYLKLSFDGGQNLAPLVLVSVFRKDK